MDKHSDHTASKEDELRSAVQNQVPDTEPTEQERESERTEALTVLGLDSTANAYVIDNRFWQLTKRYRMEKNTEKLNEITKAYDIASGRAEEKKAEDTLQQTSRKIFGKTAAQWKVHFYYSWWKYLAVIFTIILAIFLGRQIFFGKTYEIKIVSLGHLTMDSTFIDGYVRKEFDYKNPFITYADLIVDESDNQTTATLYGPASASAFLSINPDVLVFDERTMPYYLPYMLPLDSYYETLKDTVPQALLDKITPITMSMTDYYALAAKLQTDDTVSSASTPSDEDSVKHIYGFEINDPDLIRALGYTNLWSKDKPSLVFTICSTSKHIIRAEDFITSILSNQAKIVSDYDAKTGTSK